MTRRPCSSAATPTTGRHRRRRSSSSSPSFRGRSICCSRSFATSRSTSTTSRSRESPSSSSRASATSALNDAADYLEMAARLLRIKAQMLLPRREGEDAWEDPRAELVRRLLEYQQVREVVDVLERLGEDRRNRFARAYIRARRRAAAGAAGAVAGRAARRRRPRAARRARARHARRHLARARRRWAPSTIVRAVLALRRRARWRDVVRAGAEPWEVLSPLLALLELAKRGELRLAQLRPFASVEIRRDAAGEAA